MKTTTRTDLEAMGREDAEAWVRRHARRQHLRGLAHEDALAEMKRRFDEFNGWIGMLKDNYPRFVEESTVLSDPDCTRKDRNAWSIGFEQRAVELVRYGR